MLQTAIRNSRRNQFVASIQQSTRAYRKQLTQESIGTNVKETQYAVRGAIPMRGDEIKQQIADGDTSFPFNQVMPCNIGNPQAVGQGFITFNREVLAGLLHGGLLSREGAISKDAKARVEHMNEYFSTPIGAYTANSKGHKQVRQAVANFIDERDGIFGADWTKVYLTNGASEGVRIAMNVLLRDQTDGVLVPIPQYPLYSALLTMGRGVMVKYFLDEDRNWGINSQDIVKRIKNAVDLGIHVRAMVVINPGNPTGNVLTREDIESIIRICHENHIVIIADEVY